MAGFITLNQNPMQGQSEAPVEIRMPPGGQQLPRVINANPRPMGAQTLGWQRPAMPTQQQHQQQQQQQHNMDKPLPLQQDYTVKICDLREERPLTAAEAREALSKYYIYRFEKAVDDESAYDNGSSGKKKTTWTRVKRTEVLGTSKDEAARQVRKLNKHTHTLSDKKATLSGDQQRQVELVLEDLQRRFHDPRYQINLVQIDHQLKSKSKSKDKDKDRERAKEGGRDRAKLGKTPKYVADKGFVFVRDRRGARQGSSSSPRDTAQKHAPEEVSLTAYYKQTPRPEVNALALLLQQGEAVARGRLQPQPALLDPEQRFPPQPSHHPASHPAGYPAVPPAGWNGAPGNKGGGPTPQQQPQQQQQQPPPPSHAFPPKGPAAPPSQDSLPPKPPAAPPSRHSLPPKPPAAPPSRHSLPPKEEMQNTGVQAGKNGSGKGSNRGPSAKPPRRQQRRPSSSSESSCSVYSIDDEYDDDMSIESANSSSSSFGEFGPGSGQAKKAKHFTNTAANFGIQPKMPLHRRGRHEGHVITDELLPTAAALRGGGGGGAGVGGHAAALLEVDLDEINMITTNAYHAGRADERSDLRDMADRVAIATAMKSKLPAPAPMPVPIPPPAVQLHHHSRNHHHRALPTRLPPRIIQRRPSVRRVRPGDVALQLEIEMLERDMERQRLGRHNESYHYDDHGYGYDDYDRDHDNDHDHDHNYDHDHDHDHEAEDDLDNIQVDVDGGYSYLVHPNSTSRRPQQQHVAWEAPRPSRRSDLWEDVAMAGGRDRRALNFMLRKESNTTQTAVPRDFSPRLAPALAGPHLGRRRASIAVPHSPGGFRAGHDDFQGPPYPYE
ncbi:hypothetical protein B0T26DRAFT_674462 [Lasiosphaeria miniovina]|uniref:Uncharacterized protein n=1 Tax=Lasiosphaeria miniovina TaxID=1954250 RepID=A0AA40AVI1_9PEZI|nr:uncharacterized protein B0T26DRAFT_674462 [Lasiosphaeria miniovina]KAK0722805.1 hypothetical protein B0T26DRAFT_674462 [Lasiosphaeria miniovina]